MNIQSKPNTAKIRELNDQFRQTGIGGRILYTHGIQVLGEEFLKSCFQNISAFDEFNDHNDPYGEHDFGKIDVEGKGVYFKIDYYDQSMEFGSPDPSDISLTTRVMTVMLVEEY